MKRILLLLLVATAAIGLKAQDTINNDTLRYLMASCPGKPIGEVEHLFKRGCPVFCYRQPQSYAGIQLFADKGMLIHGLAMQVHRRDKTVNVDESPVPQRVRIYQQGTNRLQQTLLDSVLITQKLVLDAEKHPKYFAWWAPEESGADSLVEVYFKEPVHVHDTFCIMFTVDAYPEGTWLDGITGLELYQDDKWNNLDLAVWHDGANSLVTRIFMRYDGCGTLGFTPHDPSLWEFTYGISLPPFMPILLPPAIDTIECAQPEAPSLVNLDLVNRQAFVRPSPYDEVGIQQITFAPWPADPDTLRHSPITTPLQVTFYSNLDTARYYAAWVRNQCHYRYTHAMDTIYWTPWSEPLIFYLPAIHPNDTTWLSDSSFAVGGNLINIDSNMTEIDGQLYIVIGADTIPANDDSIIWVDEHTIILGGTLVSNPAGITAPGTHPSIVVTPNPTSGEVTVEVADWTPDMTLELLDLQGRLLHHYTLHTPHITLDLSPHPAGTYLLRLATPTGTATQRLVKQ